jgi:hypothetical protein
MADYSFNPQFANLSGLQPLPAIDVTRGANLQFRPLDKIEIQSSRPELVAEGIAGAISNIAKGALGGITARYEKEEEKEKEKRKYGYELLLEEAKQQTKNKQFIDELILKTTAEEGLSADLPERISGIREAAKRLGMVNPSGNTPVVKPTPKTSIDNDFVTLTPVDTSSDTYGDRSLSPADATFVPSGTPEQQSKAVGNVVPLPVPDEAAPIQKPSPIQQPSPIVVGTPPDIIPEPDIMPSVQRVSTQGTALTGVQVQPEAAPAPTPPLAEVQAIGKLPEQPTDIKAPRNVAGIEFEPSESAKAYDAAAKLSTAYWKLIPEQNPRTFKWSLRPEDTSGEVEKRGIDKENLILAQNKQAIEREKADRERLDAETKKLKDDRQYLDAQKTKLDDTLVNIDLIDQAISLINQNPEAVGIITQSYQSGKPLPIIGDVAGWQQFLALAGYKPSEKRLQDIFNVAEALESVKSNIGFEKLGELKSLSPTGASGLGSLTEGERKALQSTKGSIEQAQSAEILLSRLSDMRSGVIKSSGNAFMKIREVEPKYVPIQTLPILEMNPNEANELNSLMSTLKSETDKESAQYKKDLKRFKSLVDKSARIDAFNNRVFPTE